MKTFTKFIALTAILPAFAFAATPKSPGAALIQKIGNHRVSITKTFAGPNGLVGYVVVPKGGVKGSIVYTDKGGNYMFVGNLFDKNANNLTQKYNDQFVMVPLAKASFKDVSNMNWFTEGKASAPHKMYIALDPNCIYCHLLYQRIEPLIEKGQVQVRWVVVGVIKPSSMGKAAQLLLAKTNAERVKLLKQDETAFKLKTEEGGLTPLKPNTKDPAVTAAFKKVSENNVLFTKYQYVGTPVILYKDQNGKPAVYPGYPQGNALQTVVNSASNAW